jgi:hypothetical protein
VEVAPDDDEVAEQDLARIMKKAGDGPMGAEDLHRAQARAAALNWKRALVQEAEEIAAVATHWKVAGGRLRAPIAVLPAAQAQLDRILGQWDRDRQALASA